MRTFLATSAAAALLLPAGALAGSAPALSLGVSTFKVLYGHPVTLAGRISNGKAGHRILVYAQPYGAPRWRRVAAVTTRAGGAWTYRAAPAIATAYQARAAGTRWSPPVTVGVQPLVTAHEVAGGGIWANVAAGRAFSGRVVKLQRQVSGGWTTVARRRLGTRSTVVFRALPATAPIRVAMSVNYAGAGYLGATSHPVIYRVHRLALAASSVRVPFGHPLVLSGTLGTGRSGETIAVYARPYRARAPHLVARVTTRAGGRWRLRARPEIQTAYSAAWGYVKSPAVTVGVAPRVVVRELPNGHVWAHVDAAQSLVGRAVKLQRRLPGGVWQTVAKRRLDHGMTTVFVRSLPRAAFRVALSVNQAGAGLLGATSGTLRYRGT